VEVVEFAVAQGIDHEPAFTWWAPHALKQLSRIVAVVKKLFDIKDKFQFGVEVPASVADAVSIDHQNGNTLWQESMRKEMEAVMAAFHVLDDTETAPPGHQKIDCHLTFTVKMEDFKGKPDVWQEGTRRKLQPLLPALHLCHEKLFGLL